MTAASTTAPTGPPARPGPRRRDHPPSPARAAHRRTDLALLLLTLAAGITDAVSFLGLGSVFTANMTGNLVMVGMAAGRGESWTEILHGDVLRCTASFAGFTAGMLAGFRLPARTGSAALYGTLVLHLFFLTGWAATGTDPGTAVGAGLILVSAAAMGLQTAAVRRMDRAGITTTFVTGTLTSLVSGLAGGDRTHAGLRTAVLAALLAGGVAGGLLLVWAPPVAAMVAPAATAAALLLRGRA
ncbi:YoaK family protein [Streptomyces malaysiensis]|uniref:YoaK family protein n=1 Tax=Streptomyces malaysiensis TaxID=92644 RepID=UPI0009A13F34|nr:YoaK family protein [Streptomyces autolyticus]